MASIQELQNVASQIRRDIVRMVHGVQSGHPGVARAHDPAVGSRAAGVEVRDGVHDDRARHPAARPWIHPDCSEPVTPVLPMGSLQNLHRSLVVDGEPVATGIQPIGDALCHTNPTFALGASLSLAHGFTLAEIATTADDGRALALAFEDTVGSDAAARFDAVSDEDQTGSGYGRGSRSTSAIRATAWPCSCG